MGCSTVSSSIASFRRGLDSTWQCVHAWLGFGLGLLLGLGLGFELGWQFVHAWLQCRPTLSCRMVTSRLGSPACLGKPT